MRMRTLTVESLVLLPAERYCTFSGTVPVTGVAEGCGVLVGARVFSGAGVLVGGIGVLVGAIGVSAGALRGCTTSKAVPGTLRSVSISSRFHSGLLMPEMYQLSCA